MIFEVSWEVCNKVGGIYTVLRSKIPYLLNHYSNKYFAIGPYLENSKRVFEEQELPSFVSEDIINELKKEGIYIHYGKWLIEGQPYVFLIDFREFFSKKFNEIKGLYWEWYKIDSLGSPYDYDEVIAWSTAVGKFLELLANKLPFIVHINEWLSGGVALWLKKKKPHIPIVTTYHGIMLARTLVQSGVNIYSSNFSVDNPDQLAYKYNIQAKHLTERVVANISDVFTTVSEIIAKDALKFLFKKTDVITPNGINTWADPNLEECLLMHKSLKQQVKRFLMYYFFPYYTFDLEKTLFLFIASRYEFFSKGLDLYIKALGKLNQILKKENFGKTIIAFIFVPTNAGNIRDEIIKSKNALESLEEIVFEREDYIKNKILYHVMTKERIDFEDLFSEEELIEIERILKQNKKEGLPPLTTHYLNYDENNDLIIRTLKENNLINRKEDKIKVVWYPVYLTKQDGLLNLGYKDTIKAMHFGIFPSLYEPFGYTPLEAANLAIPSITTNTAGFGLEIKKIKERLGEKRGIFVIDRLKKDGGLEELTNLLYDLVHFSKVERIKNKVSAKNLASLFDWQYLIVNYFKAYDIAFKKLQNSF